MGRNTRTETQEGFSTSEIRSYAAIVLVLAAIDVAASVLLPDVVGAIQCSRPPFWFLATALVGIARRGRRGRPVTLCAATARCRDGASRHDAGPHGVRWLCGIAFFIWRNWFINPDGALFPMKFMVDVPAKGFHVTHDEMWELYIHSKFWLYTNDYFGWSVARSYQVLSCAAGAVFVFLLLTCCRRLLPQHWPLAFLACVSGGYMQLFFGDVENYTLMTTVVMGYFLASVRAIDAGMSIVHPAILLALALTFHLEAGFLLPSLVYLLVLASTRGQAVQVVVALTGFVLVVAGTFLFFHLEGCRSATWSRTVRPSGTAVRSGRCSRRRLLSTIWQIANLAFLLVPSWVILFLLSPTVASRSTPSTCICSWPPRE